MRLVDIDPLYDALFEIHAHEGMCLEPIVELRDINAVLEAAPTVDAIPVEWLKAQRIDRRDPAIDLHNAIFHYVLRAWEKQKEQEDS